MEASVTTPPRLTPDMTSFRLLVLDFIRTFYDRWAHSPSHGEIAAGTNSGRTRVRKALRSLADDDLVLLVPGTRGIVIPDRREAAIRDLRALGYCVDEDAYRLTAPPRANGALPAMPVLTYLDGETYVGANDGEVGEGEAYGARRKG